MLKICFLLYRYCCFINIIFMLFASLSRPVLVNHCHTDVSPFYEVPDRYTEKWTRMRPSNSQLQCPSAKQCQVATWRDMRTVWCHRDRFARSVHQNNQSVWTKPALCSECTSRKVTYSLPVRFFKVNEKTLKKKKTGAYYRETLLENRETAFIIANLEHKSVY